MSERAFKEYWNDQVTIRESFCVYCINQDYLIVQKTRLRVFKHDKVTKSF
jgi:hypothetical protein